LLYIPEKLFIFITSARMKLT